MDSIHRLVDGYSINHSLTQYGDGVFETMLGVGNTIHHWDYHWSRLANSCQRLDIALPDQDCLIQQLNTALRGSNQPLSVIKMIVSRGEGLRGYRSLPAQPCNIQWTTSPYVLSPNMFQGLHVRICQTRLAYQPLLAGMKHTNRLEYIMARREPEDSAFDEGILLDYDNRVIECLVSNILIIKKQKIITPQLSGAGVAGTMRAYLFRRLPELGYSVEEKTLTLADLADADSVFLSNATQGVRAVASVQGVEKNYRLDTVNAIRLQLEHPCCAF